MTSGQTLKKNLGLENLKHVVVNRAIISAYPIYFVWYDTYRQNMPITSWRVRTWPTTASILDGADILKDRAKVAKTTPIMDIERFNGNIRGALIIPVDLAGDNLIDDKVFTRQLESKNKKVEWNKQPIFGTLKSLEEFVTLADLRDTENISNVTMKFRKQRSSLMGGENVTAKLIDSIIDIATDTVTFQFLTESTEQAYPPDYQFKQTDPNTFNLQRNPSKTYEIHLQFLNFSEWFDALGDPSEIKRKDIKELLDVSNVRIWSNSPSFHYQGFNFWLGQLDGALHPTNIEPQRWDKIHGDGEAVLDKHTYGLFRQMPFFEQQMASMLQKKLKDRGMM